VTVEHQRQLQSTNTLEDDEWAVAERRYFSAESMKQTTTPTLSSTTQEILAAIA